MPLSQRAPVAVQSWQVAPFLPQLVDKPPNRQLWFTGSQHPEQFLHKGAASLPLSEASAAPPSERPASEPSRSASAGLPPSEASPLLLPVFPLLDASPPLLPPNPLLEALLPLLLAPLLPNPPLLVPLPLDPEDTFPSPPLLLVLPSSADGPSSPPASEPSISMPRAQATNPMAMTSADALLRLFMLPIQGRGGDFTPRVESESRLSSASSGSWSLGGQACARQAA